MAWVSCITWWGNLYHYSTFQGVCLLLVLNTKTTLNGVNTMYLLDSWVMSQIWLDSDSNESSRVESAVKIKDLSRVRVESRWLWFESELSQLGYCLSQIWVTDSVEEKTLIFQLCYNIPHRLWYNMYLAAILEKTSSCSKTADSRRNPFSLTQP